MATIKSMGNRPAVARPPLGPDGAAAIADETLVRRALDGDRRGFELLVQRHQKPVVNHLFRLTGQLDVAHDLAQEVFLKVYVSLAGFDSRYRFTTWLYRIASNCAIDHRRKRRPVTCSLTPATDGGRAPEEALPGSGPGPDDVLRFVELRERIELALRDLPPEYRELILLRHRMACRYDEIARITDLPLGTVKTRIFRARELRRSRLGDALDAEARP